ncbi:MAG: DUF554 domain-containing protein [Actinomycetota bacterium]|nr:DUF554 domain-containing protein [Actinomycetota bacterium]
MTGTGTVLNIAAVAVGTTAGVLFGARLPERLRATLMQGLGLFVLFLGFREATGTHNALLMLGALLAGGLIGELLQLEDRLERLGGVIQRRVGSASDAADRERFVQGFLVASLVFCVGPLTILGSIQDGLRGDIDLLATKSALDGFAAFAFASTLGWGVGASIVTIAVFQGGLTVAAGQMDDILTDRMVDEMSAVGGLMLIGIGLRLLDIAEVRVGSFLPAIVIAPVLVGLFGR